ncbi:hypothetical protein GCM10022215_05960 [Nocardioides fonticola]|uniref:Neutral metalloprotease n=1 Tax=Nocardioides fonticola TaxID=450363 RepID=A0ABP7XC00_9ACTN
MRRPSISVPALTTGVLGLILTAVPVTLSTAATADAAPVTASRASESAPATSTASTARTRARQALAAVAAIVDPASTDAAARRVTGPVASGDATFAFRDLARSIDALPKAERARAASYLARPKATRTKCQTVCLHWSTSGSNKSSSSFVKTALKTMDHVASTYVDAGYRKPLADGRAGGNGKLDVYLRNIGGQGYYGYCTSDSAPRGGKHVTPAYCVLDNDFSRREFPTNSPTKNLQVTGAHEYFHAVQFAYDYDEDRWMMEATATWAEDELYTGINDNLQYLRSSQLATPSKSLDVFDPKGTWQYGDWIFFRYLSEAFPEKQGPLPSIVLDIWKRAGTNAGEGDEYSIEAVANTLTDRGSSLPAAFAEYSWWNQYSHEYYSEGEANDYPIAPLWSAGSGTLSSSTTTSGAQTASFNHLSSRTSQIRIDSSASGRQVEVQIAATTDPDTTVVTIYYFDGTTQVVPLDPDGTADVTVTPGEGFLVHYANGGSSYTCNKGTQYSCAGKSTSDGDLTVQYSLL